MKAKDITLDDLIAELDSARLVASENGNPTAMISATMAKAKLCGLDKGETITVNNNAVTFTGLPDNLAELNAQELAKLYFKH